MANDRAPEPTAARPHMPGYAILGADAGLLPWSWAEERLTASRNYWLSTTRSDHHPHAMAVWGVWLDGAFHFSTGARSRKARNLASNARCVVTTERADEAVILEGIAEEATDTVLLSRFVSAYKVKYDWEMDPAAGGIYSVRPVVVFGFIERADQFGSSATRWTFPQE